MNAETFTMIIAVWLIILCAGVAWMAFREARKDDKWLEEADELDEWIQRGE